MTTYMSGKELFIRFTARAFRKLLSIYVFRHFPFSFEGRIWDLIVSVPDHCLSFLLVIKIGAETKRLNDADHIDLVNVWKKYHFCFYIKPTWLNFVLSDFVEENSDANVLVNHHISIVFQDRKIAYTVYHISFFA